MNAQRIPIHVTRLMGYARTLVGPTNVDARRVITWRKTKDLVVVTYLHFTFLLRRRFRAILC